MSTDDATPGIDAAGRPVRVGDTVGGTTSGRYQATIIGPVMKLGKGRMKVQVTNPSCGTPRPSVGDEKWISSDRIFLIQAATPPPTGSTDLANVLRIVSDTTIEANDFGGIDINDLVTRLEQAGYPLPDEIPDGDA